MFGLGVGEILVIMVVALIFIGPKKLPELAKGLGKGMREFQNAMRGVNNAIQNPMQELKEDITRVPHEEQFKDDPPHDQNKPEDEPREEHFYADGHTDDDGHQNLSDDHGETQVDEVAEEKDQNTQLKKES